MLDPGAGRRRRNQFVDRAAMENGRAGVPALLLASLEARAGVRCGG